MKKGGRWGTRPPAVISTVSGGPRHRPGGLLYANPLVDNYRVFYGSFVDETDPEYKTPINQLVNLARVYTHEDRAVQTPNSDTPYSWLALDLRAEPFVLTVPEIEKGRYFNIQLHRSLHPQLRLHRQSGDGQRWREFLIAGPGWEGEVPKGITRVINAETELVIAIYRTQLFNPADIENVKPSRPATRCSPSPRSSAGRHPRPRRHRLH
jgi:hypothetical protein